MPSLRIEGDLEVSAALSRKATTRLPAEIRAATKHWAGVLEARIKAGASGRPGPRTITGHYRRSWNTTFAGAGLSAAAEVGTNAPQGRRLEFGFTGVDSLGRHYSQPAFPHVRPAIPVVEAGFIATLESLAGDV